MMENLRVQVGGVGGVPKMRKTSHVTMDVWMIRMENPMVQLELGAWPIRHGPCSGLSFQGAFQTRLPA